MSQIQNQWDEIVHIESEMARYLLALGVDWHDTAAMTQLASEFKVFDPARAQAAYASRDAARINKAKLFALAAMMMRTMESAARDDRDVHGGDIWKAFAKHLYV